MIGVSEWIQLVPIKEYKLHNLDRPREKFQHLTLKEGVPTTLGSETRCVAPIEGVRESDSLDPLVPGTLTEQPASSKSRMTRNLSVCR